MLYEEMMDLVDRGLARRKVDARGYQTFKYHQKVFYDNLWDSHEALLECRGIVFDADNNIAQRPFKKIFNLGENGWDIYDDMWCVVSTKINGFMAAASFHNDELLVSTTGTTDSDYVELAQYHVTSDPNVLAIMEMYHQWTFLFEICDASDPHIVDEEPGAWLIGMREKQSGQMLPLGDMVRFAEAIGFRYKPITHMLGSEIRKLAKSVKHEGFVIYEGDGATPVLKIKSPHYLSKKALMRMGKNMVNTMYDHPNKFRQRLDEEFQSIYQWIINNYSREEWRDMSEQDRRQIVEDYFNE